MSKGSSQESNGHKMSLMHLPYNQTSFFYFFVDKKYFLLKMRNFAFISTG